MNLLYAKYFCDAVKLASVTASAKANFVTQSAVSQGIAKLEKSLGVPLVADHPNRFRLTPDGKKAFLELSAILNQVNVFQEQFLADAGCLGDLEFSSPHSFVLAVVSDHLKQFAALYPKTKVNLSCLGEPAEIKQALQSGAIDFGITPEIGQWDGYKRQVLYKGSYGLYISNEVSKAKEKDLGFILPVPEDMSAFFEAYTRRYRKEPNVSFVVGSWEVAAHLAQEGLGICYCPDYLVKGKYSSLRPYSPSLNLPEFRMHAVYPSGMRLRKSSELFLSLFRSS